MYCNFLVRDSSAIWFACATRKTQINDHFRHNRIHFSHLKSIKTTIARSRRLSFSLATNFRIGCHLQSHYYDGQHQYRQSLLVCGVNPFIRSFVQFLYYALNKYYKNEWRIHNELYFTVLYCTVYNVHQTRCMYTHCVHYTVILRTAASGSWNVFNVVSLGNQPLRLINN